MDIVQIRKTQTVLELLLTPYDAEFFKTFVPLNFISRYSRKHLHLAG